MFKITKLNELLQYHNKTMTSLKDEKVLAGRTHSNIRIAAKTGAPIEGTTLETISRIANYLGCHPFDFLEWEPDEPEQKTDSE